MNPSDDSLSKLSIWNKAGLFFLFFLCSGFLSYSQNEKPNSKALQKLFDAVVECKRGKRNEITLAIHNLYIALSKEKPKIRLSFLKKLTQLRGRVDIQSQFVDYLRIQVEKEDEQNSKEVIKDALQILPQVLIYLNDEFTYSTLRSISRDFLKEIRKHVKLHQELVLLIKNKDKTLAERTAGILTFYREYSWTKETLEALLKQLFIFAEETEETEKLRRALILLLEHWTGLKFGPNVDSWKNWWNKHNKIPLLELKEGFIRNKNQQLKGIIEDKNQQIERMVLEKDEQFEMLVIDLLNTQAYPEQLLKVLNFPSAKIRKFAVEKLGSLKNVQAVTPLIALLKDPSSEVRSASIQALIKIKKPESLEPLITLLKDPKLSISDTQHIIEGLNVFTTQENTSKIVELLLGYLKHPIGNIRSAAALELGNIGSLEEGKVIAQLIKTFQKDVLPDAQEACVKSLGRLKATAAVPEIISIGLSNKENGLRWHSIDALGQIGDPRAIEPLKQQYKKETVALVKAMILSSLAQLKDYNSLSLFEEALKAPNDKALRQKAAQNFNKLISGKEKAEQLIPLIRVLKESDILLVNAAWHSLEKILEDYPHFFELIEKYLYTEAFKEERQLELKERIFFNYCHRIIIIYEEKKPNEELEADRLIRKARCQYYLELWSSAQITYSKVFALSQNPEKKELELEYIESLLEGKNPIEAEKKLKPFAELDSNSPLIWHKRYLLAKVHYFKKDFLGAKKELDPQNSNFKKMDPYLHKKCVELLKLLE